MLITNKHYRQNLKNKKRIVIKVGSSSLVHPETGETDLLKLEQLVRVLCDLRNQGKDVVQPCGFPDSYDETYYCQRKEPAQCQKYIQ